MVRGRLGPRSRPVRGRFGAGSEPFGGGMGLVQGRAGAGRCHFGTCVGPSGAGSEPVRGRSGPVWGRFGAGSVPVRGRSGTVRVCVPPDDKCDDTCSAENVSRSMGTPLPLMTRVRPKTCHDHRTPPSPGGGCLRSAGGRLRSRAWVGSDPGQGGSDPAKGRIRSAAGLGSDTTHGSDQIRPKRSRIISTGRVGADPE